MSVLLEFALHPKFVVEERNAAWILNAIGTSPSVGLWNGCGMSFSICFLIQLAYIAGFCRVSSLLFSLVLSRVLYIRFIVCKYVCNYLCLSYFLCVIYGCTSTSKNTLGTEHYFVLVTSHYFISGYVCSSMKWWSYWNWACFVSNTRSSTKTKFKCLGWKDNWGTPSNIF